MGRTSAKLRATNRLGIFYNERTRSTPLDPKLMFCCVSYHLVHFGLFGCLTKLGAKRAELVQKFVPQSRVGVFLDQHTRSTPLYPKLSICNISYHLATFGTIKLPYETRSKTFGTSAKVRATNCLDVFRDERT